MFLLQKRLEINTFFEFSIDTKNVHTINGFNAVEKERIYSQFNYNNEIWLATNSGVWVYQFIGNEVYLKKRFLVQNHITKIIRDKNNNFWFTTLNKGVFVIPNIYIETYNVIVKNTNISSLDVINDSTPRFWKYKGKHWFL